MRCGGVDRVRGQARRGREDRSRGRQLARRATDAKEPPARAESRQRPRGQAATEV